MHDDDDHGCDDVGSRDFSVACITVPTVLCD